MKKYMFVLLILAIACAFSVSVAVAADLEKYDFDGKFTMQMEKGLDFEKSSSSGYPTFMDSKKGCAVMYAEDPAIKADTADSFYSEFVSKGYTSIGKDGDIQLFEKDGLYVASKFKDGIAVFTLNMDKDKALDSIKTLEFTK